MDNDQPSSMLHVRASTLYPLPETCHTLPFNLLCGEAVNHSGTSSDGLLALTNYRLYLQNGDRQHHIPLGLIELVEVRDMFYLHIGCKDARSYRSTFDNNEQCADWFRRILNATAPPRQLEDLFAFCFKAWASECGGEEITARLEGDCSFEDNSFKNEVERLGFDLHGAWRISQANVNYRLCSSYPPLLLVPACITDETLETVARFRSSRRIPAVVWRHGGNGAVIARCSQPEVGWLGWRSAEDEDLLKAIADACAYDRGPHSFMDGNGGSSIGSAPHTPTSSVSDEHPRELNDIQNGKKVLIMDARSYTTAVANRARGGGCECPEYYPSCDIQFMNLANIHSIRKSFHALRQLCASSADQPNWYSLLEGTRWLQHMSGLMRAAGTLVHAVERDARPVLVHCSDGWDRTPQIVALAELLLDPFYRTIEGFRVLVEREWLAFGHKFADRCGHAAGSDDQNERCPVFLQWLDCVHQLLLQFPCSFQFAHTYLIKLAQHIYSNLFGTFLCNTKQERVERVNDKTFSVWKFLNASCFRNHLYAPTTSNLNQVLWPACNVRDLHLWTEVYIGSLETDANIDTVPSITESEQPTAEVHNPPMTKTRSYGDLMGAAEPCTNLVRRSSDPNITLDTMKMSTLSMSTLEIGPDEPIRNADLIVNNEILTNGHDQTPEKELVESMLEMEITNGLYKDQTVTPNFTVQPIQENSHIPNNIDPIETNGFVDKTENFGNNLGFYKEINNTKENNEILSDDVVEEDFNNDNDIHLSDNCLKYGLKINNKIDMFSKNSDINHNGDINGGDKSKKQNIIDNGENCLEENDSDNEKSESKSETTLCASPKVLTACRNAKSNETSTDTLVAENGVISSEVLTEPCPEKAAQTANAQMEMPISNGISSEYCKVCAQNRKLIGDKHYHSRSTSGKNSRYSTPPLYSRTPSYALAATPGASIGPNGRLDVDGLVPLRSDLQHRVMQLVEEHRIKEEMLQRELHTTRMALIKQVCHNCSHTDGERIDETCDTLETVIEAIDNKSSKSSKETSPRIQSPDLSLSVTQENVPQKVLVPQTSLGSLVGSVCSTGDGQASVGESLPSDLSWEALDDGPPPSDCTRILWVPDHAVSRCTGCHTEFWLGRRKHHCRNCGRIFCADCSENTTPLPSEQLFNPVRVCTFCYTQLQRTTTTLVDNSSNAVSVTDKCKHSKAHHQTPMNINTQVTASSN